MLYWIPLLLAIEAFYSGSEIALLSADRLKLKKRAKFGDKAASRTLRLLQKPERIFASTLLMVSISVVMISILIALWIIETKGSHSDIIAIAITSPLIVVFGELIPKTLFQKNADRLATIVAAPVEWTFFIFYPLTQILGGYTSRLSRAIDPLEELLTGTKRTTREELRSLLASGKAESSIPRSERRIIRRILDFRGTEAQHALIPLVKVDATEDSTTVKEALESFQRHRHSRMPVYSERIDNIIGILDVSDLFSAQSLEVSVRSFLRPAHYAPESQELEDLIREMRAKKSEMCIVVDEYGGAVGILTIEDIFEEIVGEIQDEFDHELSGSQKLGDNRWWVPARQPVSQVNEELQINLPEGNYETLGGFLLQQFGRIPEAGDELYYEVPTGSLRFTVRKSNQRAILAVLVERLSRSDEGSTNN
ncbi:MAG: hemolysin family protein [Bdellovibrionales bacterium]|nr:hemolysin family protein [Bdellovibrionales bacterium]